jgi:putative tricarboxylic transport membrane protein
MKRRTLLSAAGAPLLGSLCTPTSFAQAGKPLRIVIPANPGGGWDKTGRALGASILAAGLAPAVEYENVGGKGGVIGLAHFVEKYDADPNALLIGGTVMLGAIALNRPEVGITRVQPVARLTSDSLLIVVPANSPYKSLPDLAAAMKKRLPDVIFCGGSSGSVDHMLAGLLVRAVGANPAELRYNGFSSSGEVISALQEGKATVGISGYSELKEKLADGKLVPLAISSRRSSQGLPSIKEKGFDVDLANWRGVFCGKKVPPDRVDALVKMMQKVTEHASWKQALQSNQWYGSLLTGRDLSNFIEIDQVTAQAIVMILKLKAN